MTRPLRASIHLHSLTHNLSQVKSKAKNSRVMAVIKANAYGHGVVAAAGALGDADAFAVASLDEAITLRDAGFDKPMILLEGLFHPQELALAVEHSLQLVVHNEQQVRWLEDAKLEAPISLWLKIDTGMHRLGFKPEEAATIWQRLSKLPAAQLSWMSHLACADKPGHPQIDTQLEVFTSLTNDYSESKSLANSAAILSRPDCHFDWVRPGIMLYGASPMVTGVKVDADLRPAMTLQSELISVQQRKKGESIGYGHRWSCPQDMTIGVVAVGYGDGYPRHAPSGTPVLVNGKRAELVGQVSMDMICVDLTSQSSATVGDPAVLWGEGLPVEEIAAYADTISYELLCGVTQRVPRIAD